MVVVSPPHSSQGGHGQEYSGQTPEVDRPVGRMPACALLAQHCNRAGDDAAKPQQDVNPCNGQEHRVGGGDFDPCYDSCVHVISGSRGGRRYPLGDIGDGRPSASVAFRSLVDDEAGRHHRDRARHRARQHLRRDDLNASGIVQAAIRGDDG